MKTELGILRRQRRKTPSVLGYGGPFCEMICREKKNWCEEKWWDFGTTIFAKTSKKMKHCREGKKKMWDLGKESLGIVATNLD